MAGEGDPRGEYSILYRSGKVESAFSGEKTTWRLSNPQWCHDNFRGRHARSSANPTRTHCFGCSFIGLSPDASISKHLGAATAADVKRIVDQCAKARNEWKRQLLKHPKLGNRYQVFMRSQNTRQQVNGGPLYGSAKFRGFDRVMERVPIFFSVAQPYDQGVISISPAAKI